VSHGRLHRQRLHDAFYRRQNIVFQAVAIMATAMMRHETQDTVIKQMRKLAELLYPEDPEQKQAHEESMKEILRQEGAKSYKVTRIDLGAKNGR